MGRQYTGAFSDKTNFIMLYPYVVDPIKTVNYPESPTHAFENWALRLYATVGVAVCNEIARIACSCK